jgi:phosphocarrier protein HPr
MITREIEIINKLGLHARAAAKFVSTAGQYSSAVTLTKGEQKINAKSIMGVMMLAASKGTHLTLEIEGPDEEQATKALTDLIEDRFGEGE